MSERISQVSIEIIVSPATALERTSQMAIEAVVLPNTAKIRISQFVVECVIPNVSVPAMTVGSYWQWLIPLP